jgi:hypothetical protein
MKRLPWPRRQVTSSDSAGNDPRRTESPALDKQVSRRKMVQRAAVFTAAGAAGGYVIRSSVSAAGATTIQQQATAPNVVNLTDAPTVALDASLGNDFRLMLDGNHAMGDPANAVDGQQIVLQVTQGTGGPFTITWGDSYEFSSDLPQPSLSTTAGLTDVLTFIYNGGIGTWLLTSVTRGFKPKAVTPPPSPSASPSPTVSATTSPASGSYRLFPSVDGPSTAISYTGNWTNSVKFMVSENARWLEGYWWWVCPANGLTVPQKFYLTAWLGIGNSATVIVPGSTVTSGTLSPGWNFVALPEPIPLAVGEAANGQDGGSTLYSANTDVNGNFPNTAHYWNAGQPGAAGIVNGPLTAFSNQSGSLPAPYEQSQGVSDGDNTWIDVQVSDTPPATYSGSYRIWPNKYDANFGVGGDAPVNYTVAVEVHLASACNLNAIWYYSPPGTGQLATECDLWDIGTQEQMASDASPAWQYPLGGTASPANGWVRCAFSGVTLPAGKYRVSVYNGASNPDAWSAKALYYFDSTNGYTGPGKDGIAFGPVSAPGTSTASAAYVYDPNGGSNNPAWTNGSGNKEPGQATFAVGPPSQYPYLYVDGLGQNYWIDVEVTPV